ncbi:MAG: adaptor protein MecA [Coprococcus sp.]|nr:adaptor protein MecA [Coprococcus sp.]
MKIEKINENQIRCTLTRADLAARELKLSELAYGTEKAKSLFHDMMQQAAYEFGFEAENIPLMIEAIPASSDSIVLIITKVEDPDELDTRFSKFSPSPQGSAARRPSMLERLKKLEGADEFLDILRHVTDAVADLPDSKNATSETDGKEPDESREDVPAIRFFSFVTLDGVIQAAHLLTDMYHGANTLYKSPTDGSFILALTRSDLASSDFNRICNMLSEYGSSRPGSSMSLAFLEEHFEMVASRNAIQVLGTL